VNAGPEKRSRGRYVAESMIELGSVYDAVGERSPASRQKQDWETARSAFVRTIAELESPAAEGLPPSTEVADLQPARKLLAVADAHVSASKASSH